MQYENRFVIFIDILGFKEKIRETVDSVNNDVSSSIDAIISAMKLTPLLFDEEDINKGYFTKSRRVTQFSDSIVVSFEVEELAHVAQAIISTHLLIFELVYKGFLCRGGMALGKMVHTRDYVFGPALVAAYELESKAAIYPRVIINQESLLETLKQYALNKQILSDSDLVDFDEISEMFTKDFDGHYYLDYIFDTSSNIDEPLYEKYYERLAAIIRNGLQMKGESERTKYYWMREKYNGFVERAQSEEILKSLKTSKNTKLLDFCKSLKLLE